MRDHSRINYIWFIIVFFLLFASNYYRIVTIPLAVYTAISLFVFLVYDSSTSLLFFMMLIPFGKGLPMKEITFFYMMIEVYKRKNVYLTKYSFIAFAIILVLEFIAEVRCSGQIITGVYLFAFLGCVMIWGYEPYGERICAQAIICYVQSSIVSASFIFLLTTKYVSFDKILRGSIRLGTSSSFSEQVFNIGANGLSMMCVFSMSLISILFYKKKIRLWQSALGLTLLAVFGIMTQSRAFIVGIIFWALYIVVFFSTNLIDGLKRVFTIIILCVSAILLLNRMLPNVLLHFYGRFLVSDISNNRIDISSGYMRALIDDPISLTVGAGLNSYQQHLGEYALGYSAHNAIVEIFLAWGVIGFIAVVILFISVIMARMSRCTMKKKIVCLFPFFTVLLMVQSSRLFSTFDNVLLVGISLLCFYQEENSKDEVVIG